MENCPACSHKIVDSSLTFCKNCKWELMIIAKNASSGLTEYYEQRLVHHKTMMALIKNAEEDRLTGLEKIAVLERQVDEIGIKNKKLAEHAESADKIKGTVEKLKKDLEHKNLQIKDLTEALGREKSAHEATKTKNSAFKI
jgi:hypothetical protein